LPSHISRRRAVRELKTPAGLQKRAESTSATLINNI